MKGWSCYILEIDDDKILASVCCKVDWFDYTRTF
jgi:hypothetical protein